MSMAKIMILTQYLTVSQQQYTASYYGTLTLSITNSH